MDWEHCVVTFSLVGAIIFAGLAVRLPKKRPRLVVPIAILLLMAIYETILTRYDQTVDTPIPLDLMVEIPLMFLLLAWGIAALIFPLRKPQQK